MNRRRPAPSAAARAWIIGLCAAAFAASAWAKEPEPAVPLPPIPPSPPEQPLPPYQGKLDRLAELLGTLAFLRDLCGNGDGAAWRDRMAALLQAEGTTPARRQRLAGSFNHGYLGYQLTYHACTAAAETVIARALDEGAAISGDVSKTFNMPSQ